MATTPSPLLIAKGKTDIFLLPKMANRHGLIAGATGTGKTVSLRVLAEQFSKIGVPVFMSDVKGDLSGFPLPGGENPKVVERVAKLGNPLNHFRIFTSWEGEARKIPFHIGHKNRYPDFTKLLS